MRFLQLLFGLSTATVTFASGAEQALAEPITLHYLLRPPYMMPSDDGLSGLTGAPAVLAFRRANVPFKLRETPFARQMQFVKMNIGLDCMIGLFKKPDREQFAKFSKPIYRDQTQVLLTAKSNATRFARYPSVEDIFNDKGLVLLVKIGYSYGVGVDALIGRIQPNVRRTADENLLMIKAIKLKMADYMIIAPEEASDAILAAGFSDSDFRQIKPKDMPLSDNRHIMCSRNVPDGVIMKLNAAIGADK